MATGRWLVILKGDPSDLRTLANYLTQPDATVEILDTRFFLRSADFDPMTDGGLVEQHAAELISAGNAAVSLETSSFRPTVEIVAAVRHHEGLPIPQVVVPDLATLELRTFPPTILINHQPIDSPTNGVSNKARANKWRRS